MAKKPPPGPTCGELLDAMDIAELHLLAMVGRWEDSIPAKVRAEIRQIAEPLLRLLLRAGRR
jgi:hypothetical protein